MCSFVIGSEKLVDKIAMGAVQFDRIEAEFARIRRRPAEGVDHALDVLLRHRFGNFFTRFKETRGPGARQFGARRIARVAHRADVPELRRNEPACVVHFLDNALPAFQRLAVKGRHVFRHGGDRIGNGRAFGDDEARAPFRPAAVIGGNIFARCLARRELACHGRHGDTVRNRQAVKGERAEKFVE